MPFATSIHRHWKVRAVAKDQCYGCDSEMGCDIAASGLDAGQLARQWQQLLESDNECVDGFLSTTHRQLIALRVAQVMRQVDIARRGWIKREEWVHYMLLANAGFLATQINSNLHRFMRCCPNVLADIQEIFMRADVQKKGYATFEDISEMYAAGWWRFQPGDGLSFLSDTELHRANPETLARDIMEVMDLSGDGRITYAEFAAFYAGRRKTRVDLHMYDLSNGASQALSPWLVGESLEGIWHTGVVVYGQEYFFASDLVHDTAGETAFGTPTKIVSFGFTLWRQEELHNYIVEEMQPVFHRGTYDIITQNCNHFTEKLIGYLVGRSLPEEVLKQPDRLMKSATISTLRPLLNWWLLDCVATRDERVVERKGGTRSALTLRNASPGAIVAIHPVNVTDARAPVIGLVAPISHLRHRPPQVAVEGSEASRGVVWSGTTAPLACGACCSCARSGPDSDTIDASFDVLVQYIEVLPELGGTSCSCRVRTEMVALERLREGDLSEVYDEAVYAAALSDMDTMSYAAYYI